MIFKKIWSKLLIFLFLSSFFSIPISVYAYSDKVIVGGENIGIEVNSKGILVVGFYDIDNISPGKNAGIEVGDVITKIDDTAINEIADLSNVIDGEKTTLKITYLRNNKTYNTNLELIKDNNNTYKTGLYVKDKIIGIGTLTFIDPESKIFGALGHEIAEKTTGKKFEIASGTIFKSNVTSIDKSTRNSPGEKNASFRTPLDKEDIYGIIDKNEINGIYGIYQDQIDQSKLMDVATNEEIKLGQATIRTVISGEKVEEFTINITKLYNNNDTKNILFEVVDQNLLDKTNGIVQGMSGSPIIQNNKIIGAVTHVVVDNPQKGYGIFITNMLEETEN